MGLGDFFSGDPAREAARAQEKQRRLGHQSATKHLNRASNTHKKYTREANKQLGKTSAQHDRLWDVGTGALDLQSDALGLNGAAGRARALQAFQEAPGSQYVRDQSMEAIKRQQASLGMLNSGNTLTALSDYTRNHFANEQWNPWQDRLSSTANRFAVPDPTPQMKAQNLMALGNNLSGLQQARGDLTYKTHLGAGADRAQHAMAGVQAGQNIFDGIVTGVNALANVGKGAEGLAGAAKTFGFV